MPILVVARAMPIVRMKSSFAPSAGRRHARRRRESLSVGHWPSTSPHSWAGPSASSGECRIRSRSAPATPRSSLVAAHDARSFFPFERVIECVLLSGLLNATFPEAAGRDGDLRIGSISSSRASSSRTRPGFPDPDLSIVAPIQVVDFSHLLHQRWLVSRCIRFMQPKPALDLDNLPSLPSSPRSPVPSYWQGRSRQA